MGAGMGEIPKKPMSPGMGMQQPTPSAMNPMEGLAQASQHEPKSPEEMMSDRSNPPIQARTDTMGAGLRPQTKPMDEYNNPGQQPKKTAGGK